MARKMKDSGIEWIGEIPKHWKVARIKNVANLYVGDSIKDNEKDNYLDNNNAREYVATKDIIVDKNIIDFSNTLYIKNNDVKFKLAPKGSSLLCIEGGSAGRKKAFLDRDVCFVNKLCCFNPYDFINKKYVFYIISNKSFEQEFNKYLQGLIGGVSVNRLNNFSLPLPSLEEQNKITSLLDKEVFQINESISAINKQIQTLEDYKKSVITETVTKGLDKNVKMKDSGIDWIGEIPKHWSIGRIKYLITSRSEKGNLSDTNKYIGLENVESKTGKYIKTDTDYIDAVYDQCKKGDLLYGKLRPNLNKVLISPFDASCTGEFEIIKKSIIDKKWLYFYFLTPGFTNKVNSSTFGAKMPRASWTFIENIKIAYPNDSEMQEIVSYIESITSATDIVIRSKQKQLQILEEYKKSLIYEYVTGKKEVELG